MPNLLVKRIKLVNAEHVELLKEQFKSKGFQTEPFSRAGVEGHENVLKN